MGHNKKLKIAILHSAFTEAGGAERVIFNQFDGLKSKGFEVDCWASTKNTKSYSEYSHIFPKIKPYLFNINLPKFQLITSLLMSFVTAPFLSYKFRNYDVLLCHHQPSSWIAYNTWKKFGTPYFCYLHHPPRYLYPRKVEKELGWGHDSDRKVISFISKYISTLKSVDYLSITSAKGVLVNSRRTANEVKEIYGVEPIVCYPSFNVSSTKRNGNSNVVINNIIDKQYVLMIGRHTPHKRLDWLLKVFKIILEDIPDLFLVVVGAFHQSYTNEIRKIADELGITKNLILNDKVSNIELRIIYEKSLLVLYISPDEDFGMVPIEASMHGVPCIVWDRDGPGEVVKDGVMGLKAKPFDLDDFATKAITLLKDKELRDHMAKSGKEYVIDNFSQENHIKIIMESINSCL